MVDWSLARQVARFAARSDDVPDLGVDLPQLVGEIEVRVTEYAQLEPELPVPAPEVVGRSTWAEANLRTFEDLLQPVAVRLDERFAGAGPFAGPLRLGTGVTLAAEVGLVTGYMAQRVLGQYELSLLAPASGPRLLFVGSNLERAAAELDAERESFVRWVAIHELTHALQFGSVTWLREYLGDLLRSYLDSVDVRIERGSAGGLPALPSPAQLVETFREGGLAALVQTREQRRLMDRMQAAMAVIEGHAEHVMDALAPELVPQHAGLREAMDTRRRSRSAPERILQRLLGMDLKLRQYELGKRFADAVVERDGIAGLNRAWESPKSLPTLAELEAPERWSKRVAHPAPAV